MKCFIYFGILTLARLAQANENTDFGKGNCTDPNADWKECSSTCPKICGEKPPQVCTLICKNGCDCKSGYILDKKNGTCIQESECKKCWDKNSEWQSCGTICPEICGEKPVSCPKICKAGCQCKSGYILDRKDGSCIEKSQCKKCPDPNSIWTDCASACPEICGDKEDKVCHAMCRPGCKCKSGYILNNINGTCIPESQCPGTCKDPNAQWTDCGTACPRICGKMDPQACIEICKIGCECKPGYILDKKDGKCIPEKSCKRCDGCHTEWTECGSQCPEVCGRDVKINCIQSCRVGCQCTRGYILDENNKCISRSKCDKKKRN